MTKEDIKKMEDIEMWLGPNSITSILLKTCLKPDYRPGSEQKSRRPGL